MEASALCDGAQLPGYPLMTGIPTGSAHNQKPTLASNQAAELLHHRRRRISLNHIQITGVLNLNLQQIILAAADVKCHFSRRIYKQAGMAFPVT